MNTAGTKASLFLFFTGCDERKTTCLKPSLVRQIYLSMNRKKKKLKENVPYAQPLFLLGYFMVLS